MQTTRVDNLDMSCSCHAPPSGCVAANLDLPASGGGQCTGMDTGSPDPVATLRRALASGVRLTPAPSATTQHPTSELAPETMDEKNEENRPITGHFVTLENSTGELTADTSRNGTTTGSINDKNANPDKLQMTIEALKANPNMTDEALAELLSLKRPASARFWRLKAIEILSTSDQSVAGKTDTTSTLKDSSWRSNSMLANGAGTKR